MKMEKKKKEISELNGCERVNLIQMTIISTVGKNPLEEME